MDITTLAAWGEFLGGIAVVISLVYLAGQIRSNTKTVRASNSGDLLTASSEFATMTADPDTASLYLRGLQDFAGLNVVDQLRFNGLMSHHLNSAYRAWVLDRRFLLEEGMWENQVHSVSVQLKQPGVKQWWTANQHWWPADFRDLVDEMVREGEAAG